jgi:hypothetical protein
VRQTFDLESLKEHCRHLNSECQSRRGRPRQPPW